MFLSKRKGIYYLYYGSDTGRNRKVSAHCRHKADALSFLQDFKESAQIRRRVSLSQFVVQVLKYVEIPLSPMPCSSTEDHWASA